MNFRFFIRPSLFVRFLLILFIFLVLVAAHSLVLPLGKSPDELWHFQYMSFIANTGRLPLNDQERVVAGKKSDWPPLYHGLAGVINSRINIEGKARLKILEYSDRAELADMFLLHNLINTYDELWPYDGEILRWRVSRLLSGLLSVATITVVLLTAWEVFKPDYRLALLAAAFAAYTPTFIFICSVMSDDAMIGLVGGLYFLALLMVVTRNYTALKYFLGVGLLMGLAIVTKYSALVLPFSFTVILMVVAFIRRWSWRSWLTRLFATGFGCLITCGWWFAFLMINFNEIKDFGPVVGLLKPIVGGNIDRTQNQLLFILTDGQAGREFIRKPTSVSEWAVQMYHSYWSMSFDSHLFNQIMLFLIGLVCFAAVVGLIKLWLDQPDTRLLLVVLTLHFLFLFLIPLVRFLMIGMLDESAQGRHVLFPAAAVVPILILYGWRVWFSQKIVRRFFMVVLAGLLSAGLGQLVSLAKTYSASPISVYTTTSDILAKISHPLELQFGDQVKLVGYNLNTNPRAGALNLSLYWQASTYPDEDYTRRLTLLKDGQTWLEWSSYPTNARYPARIWESWETIKDEISLPLVDIPPGEYQLQVQLRSADGPLPVNRRAFADLGWVTIPPVTTGDSGIPFSTLVDGHNMVISVQLWQPDIFAYRPNNPPTYFPRMVIPVVWQGNPIPDSQLRWVLVNGEDRPYAATPITPHFAYFTVGADWSQVVYRLRAEIWRDDRVIASQDSPVVLQISNSDPRLMTLPPIANPLEANFAGRIKFLGYDLPVRALAPGQPLPITLYWQGLRTMPHDFSYAIKLFDKNRRLIAQTDRIPQDDYETSHWLENEIVVDQFLFTIDRPETLPVIAWLDLNVYLAVNEDILSLPLVVNDQFTNQTSVTFGPVKIGGPPPGVVIAEASPDQPLIIGFGDVIRLRGYDLNHTERNLDLTLYWESVALTPIDYTVFVHVRNQAGTTVAQVDRPLTNNVYPSSLWDSGELIPDEITVPLPDLPPGKFAVHVGLYDYLTGLRLPIPGSVDDSAVLFDMEIE